jgi:fatty acid desaturase
MNRRNAILLIGFGSFSDRRKIYNLNNDLEENKMKLSKPKNITWWIAVIAGVLGIIANFVKIPFVSTYSFWFVAFGFVLLALATYFKGL